MGRCTESLRALGIMGVTELPFAITPHRALRRVARRWSAPLRCMVLNPEEPQWVADAKVFQLYQCPRNMGMLSMSKSPHLLKWGEVDWGEVGQTPRCPDCLYEVKPFRKGAGVKP